MISKIYLDKILTIGYVLLFIFFDVACGIDGDMVVHGSLFSSRLKQAKIGKLSECNHYVYKEPDIGQFAFSVLVGGASIFSGKYYLKKDVELCENSIVYLPCRDNFNDLETDIYIAEGLYCYLEPACILNRDTFPQGGICLR